MALATIMLVLGRPFYVMKKPEGNVITSVFGIIWAGLRQIVQIHNLGYADNAA